MFEKKETERELSLTEKNEIWCPGWFFMQPPDQGRVWYVNGWHLESIQFSLFIWLR